MNKFVSFLLIFFFITGSFAVAFSPVSASELVENSWNTKTPMSQARGGLGVVVVDGKIYAIGGLSDDGVVGTNERYDPVSDKWITLSSMPTPRNNFAIAAYHGKIYCIGGTSETDVCTVNEVYDTLTDSWSIKKPFPSVERWLYAQVVNEQIFVERFPMLYSYDPVKDTWSTKASMLIHPASEPVCAVVGDQIWVTCRYLAGSPI